MVNKRHDIYIICNLYKYFVFLYDRGLSFKKYQRFIVFNFAQYGYDKRYGTTIVMCKNKTIIQQLSYNDKLQLLWVVGLVKTKFRKMNILYKQKVRSLVKPHFMAYQEIQETIEGIFLKSDLSNFLYYVSKLLNGRIFFRMIKYIGFTIDLCKVVASGMIVIPKNLFYQFWITLTKNMGYKMCDENNILFEHSLVKRIFEENNANTSNIKNMDEEKKPIFSKNVFLIYFCENSREATSVRDQVMSDNSDLNICHAHLSGLEFWWYASWIYEIRIYMWSNQGKIFSWLRVSFLKYAVTKQQRNDMTTEIHSHYTWDVWYTRILCLKNVRYLKKIRNAKYKDKLNKTSLVFFKYFFKKIINIKNENVIWICECKNYNVFNEYVLKNDEKERMLDQVDEICWDIFLCKGFRLCYVYDKWIYNEDITFVNILVHVNIEMNKTWHKKYDDVSIMERHFIIYQVYERKIVYAIKCLINLVLPKKENNKTEYIIRTNKYWAKKIKGVKNKGNKKCTS